MDIITDNLRAVATYWWVVLVGVIMPFLDLLRFLHPKSREFRLPHWARIGIAALAIVAAESLAYRHLGRNLVTVIAEKRQLSIDNNGLTEQLRQSTQQLSECRALVPGEKSLKVRARVAADEFEKFWKHQPKQPTCNQTGLTPAQQQEAIKPCVAYYNKRTVLYQQTLAPKIMSIVAEFKGKGANVLNIENCATDAFCGIPIAVQLRALSEQLDAHDNLRN
jgi:hypothetical protein